MSTKTNIITTKAPIKVGIIKYYNDPNVKSLLPICDYVTVVLDPSIVSAKASVCASREFTEDKFWLNGVEAASELQFCLNEVKYKAANQQSVSVEFLTRKVHIACENKFLPAFGTQSFSAGFITLMTALCKLYKIRPNSVRNQPMFPDLLNFNCGGFVQSRETYANTKNFKGKQISEGKKWHDLRVLILVIKKPQKVPTDSYPRTDRCSGFAGIRNKDCVPANVKLLITAIKDRNFELFADVLIRDNNQFHAISLDSFPPRIYKNKVSKKICKSIHTFNKQNGVFKVGYTFDTGPNAVLFFLEKDASEIISFIKLIFPSTNPNFIQGLEAPAPMGRNHFDDYSIDPMPPDEIDHAIYTKVGDLTVQFDNDHLLDGNGDIIPTPLPSPSVEVAPSSKYTDTIKGPNDGITTRDSN